VSIFSRKNNAYEKQKKIIEAFRIREKRAIWASATIVSAKQESISEAGLSWRIIRLILRVKPPEGKLYTASAVWKVEQTQISLLQPGKEFSIKIDIQDPQVIFPNMTGAEYIPEY